MWDDFDLHQAWKLYKKGINKNGYLIQYPEKLVSVINFFQEKLPKYTDWKIMNKEIVTFKENTRTPLIQEYHRSDRISVLYDHKMKWELFCITIDKAFIKFDGMGLFRRLSFKSQLGKQIAIKQSLTNLESPSRNTDPESSDEPIP